MSSVNLGVTFAKITLPIKSATHSVFVKLFLIFGLSFLLMTLLVQVFMKSIIGANDVNRLIQDKNRVRYALYLVEQIGHPPDEKKAKEIAKDLGIQIQIEGPNKYFLHTDQNFKYEALKKDAADCPYAKGVSVGKNGKEIFATLEKQGYRYLFSFKCDAFAEGRLELIPLLLGGVLCLLILCFLSVRRLLKPLKWLMKGVEETGKGNFEWTAPSCVSRRQRDGGNLDEMTELTLAFDAMVKKVDGMMKAKEQLLYDVSHELRSPMTRMKLALELDDEDSKSLIRKNLKELETMVDEILESARLQSCSHSLELEQVPVGFLLEEVVSNYQNVEPGIRLCSVPNGLKLKVDRGRIKVVLRNLVENALKFSSSQNDPVQIFVQKEGDQKLIITVKDHGQGVPEGEHEKIFEPFYRVDRSRVRAMGGYGLGLNLCKRIMEAHGGEILLNSEPGKGTSVKLVFSSAL